MEEENSFLGNCIKCGKKIESYSLIDGIAEPCGHRQITKNRANKNLQMLGIINKTISKEIRRK